METDEKINKLYKELSQFNLSPFNKLHYRTGRIIMSKNFKFRYYYSEIIESPDRQDKITIIMFNPALANIDKPDKTINNVYKIIKDYTKYREFEIFNLFNIRNSNPSCNKEAGLEKNLLLLEKLLKVENNNNILLAWGNLLYKKYKITHNELKIFEKLFANKQLYVVKFTKKKQPIHLSTRNNKYIYPLKRLKGVNISQIINCQLIKTQ